MPDDVDIANDLADQYVQSLIHKELKKSAPIPEGIGICLQCQATVTGKGRWCGPDCRDEWELEQRRR